MERFSSLPVECVDGIANGLLVAGKRLRDAGGVSPRAEASKIWLRRSTNASAERNPAVNALRSSSEKSRTKMRSHGAEYTTSRITSLDNALGTSLLDSKF